jgi:hypothetical protein
MEQVGEKQDFECELAACGLRHEDFVLRVRRLRGRAPEWSCDYSVIVERIDAQRRHVYVGGPARNWVGRFAADLARGVYGPVKAMAAVATSLPKRCPRTGPPSSAMAKVPSAACPPVRATEVPAPDP